MATFPKTNHNLHFHKEARCSYCDALGAYHVKGVWYCEACLSEGYEPREPLYAPADKRRMVRWWQRAKRGR